MCMYLFFRCIFLFLFYFCSIRSLNELVTSQCYGAQLFALINIHSYFWIPVNVIFFFFFFFTLIFFSFLSFLYDFFRYFRNVIGFFYPSPLNETSYLWRISSIFWFVPFDYLDALTFFLVLGRRAGEKSRGGGKHPPLGKRG